MSKKILGFLNSLNQNVVFRRIGGRVIPFIKDKSGKSISYSPELEKKYVNFAKKTGLGSGKRYHDHHTLPVGKSIFHTDWHLRNLWEGGYKTIKRVSKKEHIESHKRIDKKYEALMKILNKGKK